MRAAPYFLGAWVDVTVAVGMFVHWLTVGLAVDAAGASLDARKGASVWLALSSLAITSQRVYASFRLLGTGRERTAPETIVGVFAEIVAISETWGACFLAARTWALPSDNEFHARDFLTNAADSVFEMALVQAGVGWAAAAPTTFIERVVAWLAAYVGGVLLTNLYLLSVVLARRGWWTLAPEPDRPFGTAGAAGAGGAAWKFESLAPAR